MDLHKEIVYYPLPEEIKEGDYLRNRLLDTEMSSETPAVNSACIINGEDLTLKDVLRVARKGVEVRISEQAKIDFKGLS